MLLYALNLPLDKNKWAIGARIGYDLGEDVCSDHFAADCQTGIRAAGSTVPRYLMALWRFPLDGQ
jgi:hypothetical protein